MKNRILIGTLTGALLGVVCIIGATLRSEDTIPLFYLFAFWYNRVIIGFVIGLVKKSTFKLWIIKGLIVGAVISFAFYSATHFQDLVGFIAGIIYGAIISVTIYYLYDVKNQKQT